MRLLGSLLTLVMSVWATATVVKSPTSSGRLMRSCPSDEVVYGKKFPIHWLGYRGGEQSPTTEEKIGETSLDDKLETLQGLGGSLEESKAALKSANGDMTAAASLLTKGSECIRESSLEHFQADVLESPVPTVVMCTASWCGPCKQLKPFLESQAKQLKGRVRLVKLDMSGGGNGTPGGPLSSIDHETFAKIFRLEGFPTLVVFQNGEIIDRIVGAPRLLSDFMENVAKGSHIRADQKSDLVAMSSEIRFAAGFAKLTLRQKSDLHENLSSILNKVQVNKRTGRCLDVGVETALLYIEKAVANVFVEKYRRINTKSNVYLERMSGSTAGKELLVLAGYELIGDEMVLTHKNAAQLSLTLQNARELLRKRRFNKEHRKLPSRVDDDKHNPLSRKSSTRSSSKSSSPKGNTRMSPSRAPTSMPTLKSTRGGSSISGKKLADENVVFAIRGPLVLRNMRHAMSLNAVPLQFGESSHQVVTESEEISEAKAQAEMDAITALVAAEESGDEAAIEEALEKAIAVNNQDSRMSSSSTVPCDAIFMKGISCSSSISLNDALKQLFTGVQPSPQALVNWHEYRQAMISEGKEVADDWWALLPPGAKIRVVFPTTSDLLDAHSKELFEPINNYQQNGMAILNLEIVSS